MASAALSDRLCEPCKEGKKAVKARTLCYECHLLLCQPCSDYHHLLRTTRDHHLVDLVHFIRKSVSAKKPSTSKQTPSTFSEDELVSDFLKTVKLTADTVLYRAAQVVVESTAVASKVTDPTRLKATKCLEFSVKRADDKDRVNVTCVLCVMDKVVVVDKDNKVMKLFDQNGTFLSCTELGDSILGMTCVRDGMFATCGYDNAVYLWKVHAQIITREKASYQLDYDAQGVHYNGTYYCVLHNDINTITILDRQGRHVRTIIMEEACGRKFGFGWDIHMDRDTNNIFVPCWDEDGLLCVTIEGRSLWFAPLSYTPWGITEIQGSLCVVDCDSVCLHLLTKEGEYFRPLLVKGDLSGMPAYLYHGRDGRLYVSYDLRDNHDKISVYRIT